MKLDRLASAVLSIAIPPLCPSCLGEILQKNQFFCDKCSAGINFIKEFSCPACGGENDGIFELCRHCLKEEKRPWKKAISLMRFDGLGRELVHRLKYGGDTVLARPLGMLLAERLMKSADAGEHAAADMIVPVPLHWTNYLVRGYNQSELISEFVSRSCGIPLVNALRRKKRTRRQARLDREERRKNILGAFYVRKREFCEKRIILLVDDVITTGSTLGAATRALLEAGASEIRVLTLARG